MAQRSARRAEDLEVPGPRPKTITSQSWIGDMKRTKSSGPRAEPWGTPVSMVVEGDDGESILTKDEQSVRYERIQKIT